MIPALLYSLPFYYLMGLQTGSSHVALFLFTVIIFALAVAALSLAVTAGRPAWLPVAPAALRCAMDCCALHGADAVRWARPVRCPCRPAEVPAGFPATLPAWRPAACSTAGKASLVLTFILLVSLLVGGFLVK